MKKEELQKRIDEIKWFHSIELPYEEGGSIVTPGIVDHCTEESANGRYGLPLDLTGKTVLDVGAMNGYFSFLAEKRGAIVTAIDPNQGNGDNIAGFMLAKEAIGSDVEFFEEDLEEFYLKKSEYPYDMSLLYGVLYHVENPIGELSRISKLTKEFAIIETAISQTHYGSARVWEFNPGFDGDETNKWYPSLPGLVAALKHVGFKKVDLVGGTPGGERVTVKAFK
jgi:tRNA (mo5U34)-methyltransferase